MAKLFTAAQFRRLLANGCRAAAGENPDPLPVVKLFTPDGDATWLLTEIDPDDHTLAFGLCDLGLGCPELGTVDLEEITALRGRLGLPVERDRHFGADRPLSVYAAKAHAAGRLSTASSKRRSETGETA
ncbi:DUF2958 domain-containing protein [Methylobacterium sp. C25]|uniref:DUF2958 domain-containing protein n=1 Tax=Methylobacterium sp. C25 TaxID=2721622 RepID=UPI001F238EBF|nr:DUF2958 domain-containing protein [Methylobacterium sp. C25]MCE4224938.1 DUF2958 domain-containing protein [Methylobacterium sp. C25]